jgi:hypothetical protein
MKLLGKTVGHDWRGPLERAILPRVCRSAELLRRLKALLEWQHGHKNKKPSKGLFYA